MTSHTPEMRHATDLIVQRERRGIWFALLAIVILGGGAVAEIAGYDVFVTRYMTISAILIALGVIAVASSRSFTGKRPEAHARRIVRTDESRSAAIDKASRYSLACTLALMSSYALLSQRWPVALLPSALIAVFVVFGVVIFLAAFLWLDRA